MTDKISYVCTECGSNDVSLEVVSAYWSETNQSFDISDIADKGHYCNDCDLPCRVEIIPWEPATPQIAFKPIYRLET